VTERGAGSVSVFQLPSRTRVRSSLPGLPEATRRFIRARRDSIDLLHLHSASSRRTSGWPGSHAFPTSSPPNGCYGPRVLAGNNRIAKFVWMHMWERDYVRNASMIHAVSRQELEELRATFGARPFVLVPNAYVSHRHDADTELIVAGPDFRSGRDELEAMAASLLPQRACAIHRSGVRT
jgi:hypothetical protein